ncbi:aminopeptidase [Aedoeadaptatus urinae]|uniref:aminopeptidase n=1 Tax=Aedoeadaptatus urinae TaxID=1871017 RepID=UPI00097D6660|nr:aminopeptidase [Peptoniphilus urinae]
MENEKFYWDREEEQEAIMGFSDDYKAFLDRAKTERMAAKEIVRLAKEAGYKDFYAVDQLKRGDRIYFLNKEKSVVLFDLAGDLEEGMAIVASHIDSPRLDVKATPLYEEENVALLKTHYYGGIKKYQWTAIPLAIHGVIVTKDGKKHEVNLGSDPGDPIFTVTDLLPHLSKSQNKKSLAEGVIGENLNVLFGHRPLNGSVEEAVADELKKKYDMDPDDFETAELEVVPAFNARDLGLDRSMVAAYGQDDKVCAYASLRAQLEVKDHTRTSVAIFADKEEIGSVGNTSMSAKYFENAVAEVLYKMGVDSNVMVRRALANSVVLSADVTAALDPNYPEVMDKKNAARLGEGVCMMKYTGARGKNSTNDANVEFIAALRDQFAKDNILWQTGEMGKVDEGGGGTVAYILAETGAEVVDLGTALFSMHAPMEVASKADIYSTYRAYGSFLTMK